jgi:hypothetical protein
MHGKEYKGILTVFLAFNGDNDLYMRDEDGSFQQRRRQGIGPCDVPMTAVRH